MRGEKHTITRTLYRLRYVLVGFVVALIGVPALLAADLTPPEISNVRIEAVGEGSFVVTWETDEDADSLINYGLSSDVGIVRDPIADKTDHRVEINGLDKGKRYFFRVMSSDQWGNQNVSGNFTVTTKGLDDIPDIEDIESYEQREIVAETIDLIDQIDDPDALKVIIDKVEERAETIILPPSIIGNPDVLEIGMDYVIVKWVTDRNSNSIASFVPDYQYSDVADNPYIYTQAVLDDFTKVHELRIVGLSPATTYFAQVSSEGEYGLVGYSSQITFTTKSAVPRLLDVRLLKVEETAATIAWTTTIPAAGLVEYINLTTGEVRQEGSPEMLTGHTIRLANLTFGTRYQAIIRAENEAGDKVLSEPLIFLTVKDELPPEISRVTNESTLYPSSDAKVQTIVSWATDEPSTCQFFYRQGIIDSVDPILLDPEKQPTEDHVQVIVDFQPSTVYQFWVNCVDNSGNESRSENFVLFTPEKEKSIIDIILENFEGAFGWVKNIGK
jgi:hypothetical protein